MLSTRSRRRSLLILSLVAGPAVIAACDDDPTEPPAEEPTFNRVEFFLRSGTTIRVDTVTTTGTQTGNRNFPAGTTTITLDSARFLKADGTIDPVVTAADFELRRGTGGDPNVTFTLATGQSFRGTFAGLTNGARSVMIQVWHKSENHDEFGQLLGFQIGP